MLDRLRFQEIEKAIFKVRESGTYGNRYLCSNEPFLIIDNASISNFSVGERDQNAVGRSTEASTATIKNVQFNLSNGQIMLNLFNTIFGDTKNSQPTTYTVNDVIELKDEDMYFTLPHLPVEDTLIIYLTDDYGKLTRLSDTQYVLDGQNVVFVKKAGDWNTDTNLITYVYEVQEEASLSTMIKQIGAEVIMKLEMQCIALDTLTEEKVRVLMKFNKVSVGTNLSISFNNSGRGSESMIYVRALPEDNQSDVNKTIFSIEVM